MNTKFYDNLIAYLSLIGGLTLSAVAVYFSVVGLIAIYPASAISIIVLGTVLEICKLITIAWIKQSWKYSPASLRYTLLPIALSLMVVTSMGAFGFLSKSHSDQNLVSGDVLAKLAIYDEKIKTEKEAIEANKRALAQMDSAIDQLVARSTNETGIDKSVAVRRSQQKERSQIAADISASQKKIVELNDQRAPVAAEVRKVDAEVGPIKYIAALIYGANPDVSLLEKAVIWVTVLLVIGIDPLAVLLLLASQFTFQYIRENSVAAPVTKEVVEQPVEEPVEQPVDNTPNFSFDQYDYLKKPWAWHVSGATPREPFVYTTTTNEVKGDTYIQNEEQQVSNRWSAVNSVITPEQYQQVAQEKRNDAIEELAQLVRSKQIDLSEVPEDIRPIITNKV